MASRSSPCREAATGWFGNIHRRDARKACYAWKPHMKTCHWRASMVALLLGAGLLALTVEDVGKTGYPGFLSSAHAQPLRKVIARLRGQTLPAGIAKGGCRIEPTQADVASKYPGQLAEISVE